MKTATSPRRAQLIKLIHVARRDLERQGKLDEPGYRAILQAVGGAESAAAMDVPTLDRVLERLKKAGFQVRPKAGDRRQDTRREATKVRALWLFLHALGVVKDPSEAALAKYVKRIAYVDDMHWADGQAMLRLIETLKKWCMRFLPAAVAELQIELFHLRQAGQLTPEQEERAAKRISALVGSKTFDPHWDAWQVFSEILGRPVPADARAVLGARA